MPAAVVSDTLAYCQDTDCHVGEDSVHQSARATGCAAASQPKDAGSERSDAAAADFVAVVATAGDEDDETAARMASFSQCARALP